MIIRPIHSAGFTLVELMVTVSIAGILMAMAIPSFNDTIQNHRLTTYANEFITAMNLARSEAIKRGQSVTVRVRDNNSAKPLGATTVYWESGWDVFTDADSNGIFDSHNDILIRTFPALKTFFTLRGNSFPSFIRFNSSGRSNRGGSFVLCDNSDASNVPKANSSRRIVVSSSGRIRVGLDTDNNGIPNIDASHDIISCTSPFTT
jgi:type IV fimbrial biogenesis protein FimT